MRTALFYTLKVNHESSSQVSWQPSCESALPTVLRQVLQPFFFFFLGVRGGGGAGGNQSLPMEISKQFGMWIGTSEKSIFYQRLANTIR